MDFLEIFENLGLGSAIIILFILIFVVFLLIGAVFPLLLGLMGNLIYFGGSLIIFVLVVYFIGKFAKGFLK